DDGLDLRAAQVDAAARRHAVSLWEGARAVGDDGAVALASAGAECLRRLQDCRPSRTSQGGEAMKQYAILRRSGWRSPEDLQEAAARSTRVGNEEMPDDVRWIRSYVLQEDGGSVGTVCIYEATSPDAIRQHASR